MWILRNAGAELVQLANEKVPAAQQIAAGEPDVSLSNGDLVEINFPNSADGRGFSLARRFRRLNSKDVKLVATGHLLPDQARMAFQCGFDEVWVSDDLLARHGQQAWRDSVKDAATDLYVSNPDDRVAKSTGWDGRHQEKVTVNSLTAAETYEELQKRPSAKILDVRTHAELSFVGRVSCPACAYVQWKSFPKGEVNPEFLIEVQSAGLTKNCPIYVLCRSGVRSLDAAQKLKDAGFKDLTNISDGFEGDLNAYGRRGKINGWKASGLPWQQQ